MTPNPRRVYSWVLVGFLWLIACLNYVDRQAIFSVLPVIRSELRISDVQISLLGTSFLWIYGLSSPLAGYLGDRWRRRNVVVLSLVLFSGATMLTGMAESATALIALRGLLGVSEALYLPAAAALIAAYHPPESRSKAIGIHLSGLSIGGIVGGTLAGYLADHHGWRAVFRLLGVGGWCLGLASWFFIREPPVPATSLTQARAPFFRQLPLILAKKTVLAVMFSGVAVSMAGWVLLSWLPLHLYDRFHLTLTRAAFDGTFYFGVSTVAGTLAGSIISDRWSRQERGARLRLQVIGLTVYGLALLAAGAAEAERALLVCLGAAGLGRGFWDCNSMPVFCEVTESNTWSTTYGLYNLANVLGGGLAVFVAGALRSSVGLNGMLPFFCFPLIAAAALTYVSLRYFFPGDRRQAGC